MPAAQNGAPLTPPVRSTAAQADNVNTFVVGIVGMGVIGALWIALSAAVYSLLERRPRMRWAHAPLIKKATVLQTGSTVQQSVTV